MTAVLGPSSDQIRSIANQHADTLTEPPSPRAQVPAETPPTPITHVDRARLSTAALRATRVLSGPIGELVARELTSWSEIGFRFGSESSIYRLVEAVMAIPFDPDPPLAA